MSAIKRNEATGRFTLVDLTAHRFDRLLVIRIHHRDARQRVMWECLCDCGKTTVRRADYLILGKNQSCGCLQLEINAAVQRERIWQHGISRTPTGRSYFAMMTRCFNRKSRDWQRYGKIGRTVCDFLRATPVNIIVLIGEKPAGKSLDRIDNHGHYSCGFCQQCFENGWDMNIRWATPKEQANNLG